MVAFLERVSIVIEVKVSWMKNGTAGSRLTYAAAIQKLSEGGFTGPQVGGADLYCQVAKLVFKQEGKSNIRSLPCCQPG